MKQLDKKNIIAALQQRIDNSQNAVRLYFDRAGVPVGNEECITLNDMANLMKTNYQVWEDCIRHLYSDAEKLIQENPQHFTSVANADGEGNTFDYVSLIGGVLTGAGGVLLNQNGEELVLQQADYERQLAAQEAASSKRTLWIVLGILAVIIIAAVFIFRKRF